MEAYADCRLCPRECGVDRTKGKMGFCGETDRMRLACATLHRGEEPPLISGAGSGALFFSGCTLGCGDCQNCQISRQGMGAEVDATELAEIMLRLEERGASNINCVTGTHFVPGIIEAVQRARAEGLALPLVWNTSGFESPVTLELLEPYADIYLWDMKTLSAATARERFGRSEYPEAAKRGLKEILKARALTVEGDSLVRGVIVRHLVLPGCLEDTLEVIDWYGRNIGSGALFSLMTQFIDPAGATSAESLSSADEALLFDALDAAGIDEGFVQEAAEESDWLPDFGRRNPFPGDFSTMVWHWREGPL